jgi:hypothetical protein
MVWSFIKRRLRGRRFQNEDELFAAIEETWNEIDQDTIDLAMGSFRARREPSVELGRESQNEHWQRVHEFHHQRNPQVPEEPTEIEEKT